MTVKGTMNVEVTIDKDEAFKALVNELGLTRCFDTCRDEYYAVVEGKIRHFEDTSYHGSPNWEMTSYFVIDDPNKVKAFELLSELQKVMKDM